MARKMKDELRAYSQLVEEWRDMAFKRQERMQVVQEDSCAIHQKLGEYILRSKEKGLPLTISGMVLAVGVSKEMFRSMVSGEKDYLLESFLGLYDISYEVGDLELVADGYENGIPYKWVRSERICAKYEGKYEGYEKGEVKVLLKPYSEILEQAILMHEEEAEIRLAEKGRNGDIFMLKSRYGWQEEKSPQTVNQTLVLASTEEAKKALELLK